MQEPVRHVWSRAVARVLGSWQRVLAIHLAFTAIGGDAEGGLALGYRARGFVSWSAPPPAS